MNASAIELSGIRGSGVRPIRRPRRRLFELSLVSLAAIALILVLTLRLPIADIKAQRRDTATITLHHGGEALILASGAPVVLTPAAGRPIAMRADALVDGIVARGDRAEKRAWWAQRDAIRDAFAAGPVTLRLSNGETVAGSIRPRAITDLTGGFWAALLTGFAASLCGMWVLVMRPGSEAARTFAFMSLGLFGAGCTIAAGYDPLLLGARYRTLMLLNHASVQMFGAAILVLFCRFPLPLLPRRWLAVFPLCAVVLTVVDVGNLVGDTIALTFAAIAVEFVLFVLLLIGQAWAARSDPVGRAAMRLIGISASLSSALFVGLVIVPMLVVGAPIVSEAIALPLLLLIYAGLGAAIVRNRLFTVDGWALGLLLSVCAAIGIIAIDVLILSFVAGSRGSTLPIAIAAAAIVYLPVRQSILRRADRRRGVALRRSLRLASELAFAITPEARAERWRTTLMTTFEPLEISPGDDAVTTPELAEDGVALRLPAIAGTPALSIRHAQRGARDFDAIDLRQARELVEVIHALMGARDAYVRGVTEERGRIAQDLHDDVSARLMTSLHREDPRVMRDDVREAMADIRTIVGGLVGRQRHLDDLIADLRHETASRLEAHGIAMAWPLTQEDADRRLLDYSVYRHILSIVRELVSNVIRHAGADTVEITASVVADRLLVSVADDGCGVHDQQVAGHGLANIARRAGQLGGSFAIVFDGGRTRARLELPLPVRLPETGYGSAGAADLVRAG